MRGRVTLLYALADKEGITPAYAGKRARLFGLFEGWKDHPRVCGEEKDNPDEWSEVQGSPPRMRGRVAEGLQLALELGITPAYAGKSRASRPPGPHRWDHPRVCGEESSN